MTEMLPAGEYSPTSQEVDCPQLKLRESEGWSLATRNANSKSEFQAKCEAGGASGGAVGGPCVRVQSEGENEVRFDFTQRVPAAEKGTFMLFKGWLRPLDGTGRLILSCFKNGKSVNVSNWSCGNFASYESSEWSQCFVKVLSDGSFDEVMVSCTFRPVTDGMVRLMTDAKDQPISGDRAALITNRVDFCVAEPKLEIGKPLDVKSLPKVEGYFAKRVEEKLAREAIAMPNPNGTEGWYVTWRLLKSDARDAAFNVFRREKTADGWSDWVQLNEKPILVTTDFLDLTARKPQAEKDGALPEADYQWKVTASDGTETLVRAASFEHGISIKLRDPEAKISRMAIADLTGDGRCDYIFMMNPTGWVDPYYYYWHPSIGTLKLEAYSADGEWLWSRDLGAGIENGVWYSPFIAADLDGDGRAEVAVKTAGTEDGAAQTDSEASLKNSTGRVDHGAEYLSIWDGLTGKEITRTDWPNRNGLSYNYYCRSMLSVAYLDGKTPILLALRGTYSLQKMRGWQFRDGKLEEKFFWTNAFEEPNLWGRGSHTLHSTDVDGDGRDEIAVGTFILDDTGATLWAKGLHHPDHLYVGDVIPSRPGLEIYWGIEGKVDAGGMGVLDAKTGEFIWKFEEPTYHIHAQGMCADIDPAHPGCECFGGEEKNDFSFDRYLWSAEGKLLQRRPSPKKLCEQNPDLNPEKDLPIHDIARWNLGVPTAFWNADPQKEIIFGHEGKAYSYGKDEFCEPYFRFRSGSIVKTCDVLGDWREEVFVSAPGEVRIYATKIPAETRRPTLLQDRNYRASILESSMGYAQTPMLGCEE